MIDSVWVICDIVLHICWLLLLCLSNECEMVHLLSLSLISLLGEIHPSGPEAGRVSLSTHNINLPFILLLKRGEGGNIETKSRKGPNRLASSVQNKEEGDWNNGMDINRVWWLCNHSLHQNGLLIQSMGDKKLRNINCKIGRTRTDAKSLNWNFNSYGSMRRYKKRPCVLKRIQFCTIVKRVVSKKSLSLMHKASSDLHEEDSL